MTPWSLGIILSPVKCYQLSFLLTLPTLAGTQVSRGVQKDFPGQLLCAGAVQLRCSEVAYRETTHCIYFSTWFQNNQKENLNRKVKEDSLAISITALQEAQISTCAQDSGYPFSWLKCFITLFFMSLTLSGCRKTQDFNSYSAQYTGLKNKKVLSGRSVEADEGAARCTLFPHAGRPARHLGIAAPWGRAGGSSGSSEG